MLSDSGVASAVRRMMRKHHTWPVMVMAVGSLATTIAAAGSWRAMDLKGQELFLQEAEQTQVAIQDRMETYIAVLRATAALFAASDDVTRAEFATFATRLNLPERYPGIQGRFKRSSQQPDAGGCDEEAEATI